MFWNLFERAVWVDKKESARRVEWVRLYTPGPRGPCGRRGNFAYLMC